MSKEVRMLEEKVKKLIEELNSINSDGGIEVVYTDYRERELSSGFLSEIFEHENPKEAFFNKLSERAMDYSLEYGYNELEKEIKENLTEDENKLFSENTDIMRDAIAENTYFYYNPEDLNHDIYVNIMVDVGNWNYDCTCDNVLNWYGNSGDGTIDNESSMLWLAKTQGKATALRKACKKVHRNDGYYVEREEDKDKFVESCIQEFENLSSHMGTVTFLVKMNLFQLFDLLELQNNEYDEKGNYDPRKNEKSKSYIVLGKETMCGLYDSWGGGGSVLGIELDRDVKLPIKYCVFSVDKCKMHGYDVGEVYRMSLDAWTDIKAIKEVH